MIKTRILEPQAGKQKLFIDQTTRKVGNEIGVDVVLYGGGAGGGKTFGLLFEVLRNCRVSNYEAIIFRQHITHINTPGGLYYAGKIMYKPLGARCVKGHRIFYFDRYGTAIRLAHSERDDCVDKYQGTEIPVLCFDELTHFTEFQFFYLLSRNKTTKCKIKPYCRATCNPDSQSWVRKFIDWYIDSKGLAIEERCGVVRYFVRCQDTTYWFDSKEEARKAYPDRPPASFTFINSSLKDNPKMTEADPSYESKLGLLDNLTYSRHYLCNWNIELQKGNYFKRSDFDVVDNVPANMVVVVRAWDFAQTAPSESNKDPDYTVGLKMGIDDRGVYYVMDIQRFRFNAGDVLIEYTSITQQDGHECISRVPKDPGGMTDLALINLRRENRGYSINDKTVSKSKTSRAGGVATEVRQRNVKILRSSSWNDAFFTELSNFPFGEHDDQVDAFGDALDEIIKMDAPVREIKKPEWMS